MLYSRSRRWRGGGGGGGGEWGAGAGGLSFWNTTVINYKMLMFINGL